MTETPTPTPSAPAPAATPLLVARNITKSFGSVQALSDVDFDVHPGEVMALVGDNGAGKSTLIKCIVGIYPIDEGEIEFEGKKVSIHGPKDAAKLGIEVVYQDLALCDNLDVVQNMYLGREEHDLIRRLKEPVMEARTRETRRHAAVLPPAPATPSRNRRRRIACPSWDRSVGSAPRTRPACRCRSCP